MAVGLVASGRTVASVVSTVLITVVFVAVAVTYAPDAVVLGPLYALTVGVTSLVATTHRLARSPLLEGEPYGRRLLLVLAHERAVSDAARAAERDGTVGRLGESRRREPADRSES